MTEHGRYRLAASLGIARVLRRVHRHRALILCYHAVVPDEPRWLGWTAVSAAEFRTQLGFLTRHYRVLPLRELVERLRAGRPLPPHAAAVTFDDGYLNNYTTAFPILRELEVPATIFVTTDFVGGSAALWPDRLTRLLKTTALERVELLGNALPLATPADRERARAVIAGRLKASPAADKNRALDALERALGTPSDPLPEELRPLAWDDARAMQASGLVDLGSHTAGHQILSRLDPAGQRREIERSCTRVGEETGRPCLLFAYPNGQRADFDAGTQHILREVGMHAAVTAIDGLARRDDDLFALPRVLVGAHTGQAKFELQASGLMAALPRRAA